MQTGNQVPASADPENQRLVYKAAIRLEENEGKTMKQITGSSLQEICAAFGIQTQPQAYGNGHINDTYFCRVEPEAGSAAENDLNRQVSETGRKEEKQTAVILQRLNTEIFHDPEAVMENIGRVTAYLKERLVKEGKDPLRGTLTVIPAAGGERLVQDKNGNVWRMYRYIEDSVSYEEANPKLLYQTGKAFGRFQVMLKGFPAETLHETIPEFHNTKMRLDQLEQAVRENRAGRAVQVTAELEQARRFASYASLIMDGLEDGSIPYRVLHNDTKLNNVLFDRQSNEALCVIDLDTVMPGSLLFDYGDALRYGASSGKEDEPDLSRIWFDMEKFEAFTRGFLEQTASFLTEREKELLPVSALILTYENGMRFLADYLNGDCYYKISRPSQNLDRCRTHLKLAADIERRLPQMKQIVLAVLDSVLPFGFL